MNGIQPLIYHFVANKGIVATLKPLIVPLFNHNFAPVTGFLFGGVACAMLTDTLIHKTFNLEQGTKASIITKIAVFALSTIIGGLLASQFTLLAIPATALKIAQVSEALLVFKIMAIMVPFVMFKITNRNKQNQINKLLPYATISYLIAGSIFPLTHTLLVTSVIGSIGGIAFSTILGTFSAKKTT